MSAIFDLSRRWHLLCLTVLTLIMTLPGLASIPVIDRDEARYVQASVQMVESGDWLEIRFQDEGRNKKPAGSYWAQSTMLTFVGGADRLATGDRPLWAQRLPSVIAGILAVWLTYFAAHLVLGRRGALLAGSMLATSLIFVFEAHIAKTDALLLASSAAVFLALCRLRTGKTRGSAWLFWGALGASMMIKGPIIVGITALCLGALAIWDRRVIWLKPLLKPLPILLFILIWLPWVIAINQATDGAFLAESLGRDFGGKIVTAQENHSGPPGYYALSIFVSLWPACLFLLPGLVFAWKRARATELSETDRILRLCLAWVIPFWIVLELAPTKLIHYPLPLFPGLTLMMSGAILAMMDGVSFRVSKWISATIFAIAALFIAAIIFAAQLEYGSPSRLIPAALAICVSILCAAYALWTLRRGNIIHTGAAAGLSTILLSLTTYGLLLPAVESGRISQTIAARAPGQIVSPTYTEPSLVYYGGTDEVFLGEVINWYDFHEWENGTLVIDRTNPAVPISDVEFKARELGACLSFSDPISGLKYSNFEDVELVLIRQVACESTNGVDQ